MSEKFQTIVRVIHNEQKPYVQLDKKTLWNSNLSLKAVGLWARCMSRPDDWSFNISELVDKCKEGRRSVDAAMKELMDIGLVCRFEHLPKTEEGHFTSRIIQYVFFEVPSTEQDRDKCYEEFKKFYRDCGYGNCRYGNFQNDELPKTETKTKKEVFEVNEGATPSMTPSISKEKKSLFKGKRVLTPDQQVALEFLIEKNIDSDFDTLTWWAVNYSYQRLVEVHKESTRRKPKSIGAYMGYLLKNQSVVRNDTISQNAEFASDFKHAHGWINLEIHQKYATIQNGNQKIELEFNQNPIEFAENLMNKYENFNTSRV